MKKIRLVLCDIDGTLVTTGCPMGEKTKEVIERLHAHGVMFGIASGRSVHQQLSKQAKAWGFEWPFDVLIGMNGSELWDEMNQTHSDYYQLSKDTIKEIIEFMEPFHLNPFMYYHDVMLCMREDENMRRSSKRNMTKVQIAEDISQMYSEDNAKIMFRMKDEQMPEVEAYCAAHPSEKYRGFKTQTNLIEFMDPRVNKAIAMKEFCKRHDIPIEEVWAFGDMSNDKELVDEAGWGVCLLNGADDTKAVADEITEKDCDHEGFAWYVEEKILKPRGW